MLEDAFHLTYWCEWQMLNNSFRSSPCKRQYHSHVRKRCSSLTKSWNHFCQWSSYLMKLNWC